MSSSIHSMSNMSFTNKVILYSNCQCLTVIISVI
ncbi:hypothetical protein VPH184E373B_0157 [Vibrio phage 184E37-3b]